MKRIKYLPTLLIISIMMTSNTPINGQSTFVIGELNIKGEIVDNYLDLEYSFTVKNTRFIAYEYTFNIPIIENIYLSNVSIELNSSTIFGKVFPIEKSESIYNETVEQGRTGALITDIGSSYRVNFNLAAEELARITFKLEGVVTRKLGNYKAVFLPSNYFSGSVNIDIKVISNQASIIGLKMEGLIGPTFNQIPNGFTIKYNGTIPFDDISLVYGTTRYSSDASIIGYNNGTENFFAYYLAPEINTSSQKNRHFVFLIDRSGSMDGQPMRYVKQAFKDIIISLKPNDKFNVITFNHIGTSLWQEPGFATESNKNEAVNWVDSIVASGSTNIYDPIIEAFDSFGTVDTNKINGILLLSDGKPNSGTYVNDQDILNNVRANNVNEIPISTIAFGNNADENLMYNLAIENNGAYVKITSNEQSASEILRFFNDVAQTEVIGWSLKVTGVKTLNYQKSIGTLSDGNEIVITGTFNVEVRIETEINYPDQNSLFTRVMNTQLTKTEYSHVERLWAIQRIDHLDQIGNKDEVIDLAMYYGLVVKGYTSMVLSNLDVRSTITTSDNEYMPPPQVTQTTDFSTTPSTQADATQGKGGNTVTDTVENEELASSTQASTPLVGIVEVLIFVLITIPVLKRKFKLK